MHSRSRALLAFFAFVFALGCKRPDGPPQDAGVYGSYLPSAGPAGEAGAAGATGAAGVNAYTALSSGFTQPAVSSTVTAAVGTTAWMVASQTLYVAVGGYYSVSSITDGTHVVLTNLGYPGNASPAASVTSGGKVSPAGLQGATGDAGGGGWLTATDLDFTAQSTQTFASDTTYTVAGNANWRAINMAATTASTVITNGTGLVFKPSSATDMNGSYTAPTLGITLASIIPNYDVTMHVRVWSHFTTNLTANYDDVIAGFSTYNSAVAGQLFYASKFGFSPSGQGGGMNFTFQGSAQAVYDNNGITDTVVMVDLPAGIFGTEAIVYTGTWSTGWPLESTLKARAIAKSIGNSATYANTSGNLRSGTDAYAFVGAQRAASGTALTVTFANMRVDYKP